MTRPNRPALTDPGLQAIKNELDKTTNGGRDEDAARRRANAYVADHPAMFETLRTMTYEQCCQAVSNFRADGRLEDQWRVETWILHEFAKQHIGGAFQARVRTAAEKAER